MGGAEPIRVLHVDDEASFTELLAAFFEQESNMTVHSETDPEAALEVLDETAIDCVVSDYQMPAMDGLAFYREVRRDHDDLPFVLFTGRGTEELAAKAVNRGVDGYFRKDADTGQYPALAHHVRTVVNANREDGDAPSRPDDGPPPTGG
jgi:DNA-binding NarL/FixJ family response regulator